MAYKIDKSRRYSNKKKEDISVAVYYEPFDAGLGMTKNPMVVILQRTGKNTKRVIYSKEFYTKKGALQHAQQLSNENKLPLEKVGKYEEK